MGHLSVQLAIHIKVKLLRPSFEVILVMFAHVLLVFMLPVLIAIDRTAPY